MAMSTAQTGPIDESYFRDTAIELVKRGFHVIRLRPGGNLPKDKEYYNRVASTPEAAHSMWTDENGFPERFNIGILTGTPLPDGRIVVVADLDVKDGRDGPADARRLGLPPTLLFKTKSGGFHLVYGAPADGSVYRSSARSKLAAGVDTRGWHGYIVAPGSIVGDATYRIHRDAPIADAPQVLIDHMRRTPESSGIPDGPDRPALAALDEDHALVWAAQFLTDQPDIPPGQRNDTVAEWTRMMRDRALSPAAIIEAFQKHHNLGRDPAFADELVKTVNSAWNSSRLPAGNKSAAADFVDMTEAVQASTKREGLILIPASESPKRSAKKGRRYLVKNFLNKGEMSVLFGPPGAGKTFLSLDLAFHVATGLPWAGNRVEQHAVVYLLGEGSEGVHDRITALLRRFNVPEPPLFLVTQPIDLFSPTGHARAVVDAIREAEDTTGFPVGLTVIDTLARAMAGGDENSTQDMSQFVKHVDLIRHYSSTHTLLVHHTGKDAARGARGSSALLGATDTEIEVEQNRFHATKQRNISTNLAFDFRLISTTLGTDLDGDPVTTATVEIDIPSPDDIPDQAALDTEVKAQIEAELASGISPLATRVLDFLLARRSKGWIQEKVLWESLPEHDDAKPSAVRMRRLRALTELALRGAIVRVTEKKQLKLK